MNSIQWAIQFYNARTERMETVNKPNEASARRAVEDAHHRGDATTKAVCQFASGWLDPDAKGVADQIAASRALRQLREDHLNAVGCEDDETPVPTDALGIALAEVDRLTAELAKFTHWEPTVKDEYEHACAVAERAEDVVREFKREHEDLWTGPDQNPAVVAFVVALENALEMR